MIENRTATSDDLRLVLAWAAEEGWNPGLEDADAFFAADPQGFFVATDNGEPVAAISVVNHTDQFAFLGLYLARPSHRGRGIGYALWNHAIAHAGDRTIGLDGVPDQQDNYVASGFRPAGGTTRFSGQLTARTSTQSNGSVDIDSLIVAEGAASGCRKGAYLSAWFQDTPTRKTLTLGSGRAFCTVRKCGNGAKVGPLLAPDRATAEELLYQAAAWGEAEIIVDVPQAATGLRALCVDLGLVPSFETARMYRGPYSAQTPSYFAVTTLELG